MTYAEYSHQFYKKNQFCILLHLLGKSDFCFIFKKPPNMDYWSLKLHFKKHKGLHKGRRT